MSPTPRELAIADYDRNFLTHWNRVVREYRDPSLSDRVWLAGPSSYVFSLAGQRFAIDLQIRREKDQAALLPHAASDWSDLSFVLITHPHDDHMCIPLMRALKDTPIRWYLPLGCREDLVARSEIKEKNIVWVKDGDVFSMGSLTVRAFDAPHVCPEDKDFIFPQRGYELSTPRGNILLPADVRDYTYDQYPDFGEITLCISHLWAGDNALEPAQYLPMLDQFASFSAAFGAKQYFLCHLYEIARKEQYLWHDAHAALAAERIRNVLPHSEVLIPRLGESYPLFEPFSS